VAKTLDELRAELSLGVNAKKPVNIREGRPEEPPPEFTDSDLLPKVPVLPSTADVSLMTKADLIEFAKASGLDTEEDLDELSAMSKAEIIAEMQPASGKARGTGVDLSKMKASKKKQNASARERRTSKGGKYVLSADGSDATLLFGKHNGESVSTLARGGKDSRGYLKWIIGAGDFDADLVEICDYQLDLHE